MLSHSSFMRNYTHGQIYRKLYEKKDMATKWVTTAVTNFHLVRLKQWPSVSNAKYSKCCTNLSGAVVRAIEPTRTVEVLLLFRFSFMCLKLEIACVFELFAARLLFLPQTNKAYFAIERFHFNQFRLKEIVFISISAEQHRVSSNSKNL